MSRLRRPFLYDRYIFVTVKLLPSRAKLGTPDYERLGASLARMRQKHSFAGKNGVRYPFLRLLTRFRGLAVGDLEGWIARGRKGT
jgi:hypothetical protein